MKAFLIFLAVIVFLLLFVVGPLVGSYNKFIRQQEGIETQLANVGTQLQRRFDLIDNLVASVQGFFTQEQKVFGDIAEARTKYAGSEPFSEDRAEADGALSSAIGRLLVIVENYPPLQSVQPVQGLMDELAGTENRIAKERRDYNLLVRNYNQRTRQFPLNIIANIFGFEEKSLFEAAPGAEVAPDVQLNQNLQVPVPAPSQ